ncbi:hypothetical protein NDU88_003342 [Pleurodeles waltl]|uniref:Uncharacterized protein n=1 Tax=Pleurodeles waltl TaxID=8319 RepID=A0AAV7UDF4_PLEWA|nr:hypothetical protein NDU88_003342 [Pleurodeles waltl]
MGKSEVQNEMNANEEIADPLPDEKAASKWRAGTKMKNGVEWELARESLRHRRERRTAEIGETEVSVNS